MQLTILLLTAMLLQRPATAHLHPHTFLTTPEIIRARGYPAQTHHVTTSDGYVLQMHRIPGGRGGGQGAGLNGLDFASSGKNSSSNNRGKQKVAFLQHCVLCSSADFILNDPDQAIAFILADLGYDVWLGNIRGNVYSRRHVRLSPNQPEFWDYSIDEIARYDVPAMLTYVREATGSPTLSYVGHSMGTSVFFAMMNYHPQINNWVRVMAAMAPVAYIHNARIFQFYAPLINALENYQSVILAHNPAGISSNVLRQYLQFNSTRRFQAFDRGAARNQREYGSASPPRYSLARVTVPVGLFWSDGDWLVDSLDVRQTASELPRVALNYRVPLSDFNHNDFLWAENAKDLVYGQLVRLLEAHN
ncbi:lipase lipl-4-like isoform X2 [Penaeus chinensis]|uniref:lipase lipl-4-like isoform X2 n=1 Tax=Penaeus chinensis TaxID=139456 RepID=UPI001FB6D8E4|nr:lipase lipl-4-like isoform X2 [Penaeus chinensis]